MSKIKVELKPSYTQGGGIAAIGLVVAWLISFVVPDTLSQLAVGAVTGGFGVAAAGRIWPGLPLRLMWQYALGVMAYGVVVGLLV
ncbi:MAG: hypothetical protein AAGA28_04145 [Pseudomonadota bacterium]